MKSCSNCQCWSCLRNHEEYCYNCDTCQDTSDYETKCLNYEKSNGLIL